MDEKHDHVDAETANDRMVAAGVEALQLVVGQRVRRIMVRADDAGSTSQLIFLLASGQLVSLVADGRLRASVQLNPVGSPLGTFAEPPERRKEIRSTLLRLWSNAQEHANYDKAEWRKLAGALDVD